MRRVNQNRARRNSKVPIAHVSTRAAPVCSKALAIARDPARLIVQWVFAPWAVCDATARLFDAFLPALEFPQGNPAFNHVENLHKSLTITRIPIPLHVVARGQPFVPLTTHSTRHTPHLPPPRFRTVIFTPPLRATPCQPVGFTPSHSNMSPGDILRSRFRLLDTRFTRRVGTGTPDLISILMQGDGTRVGHK